MNIFKESINQTNFILYETKEVPVQQKGTNLQWNILTEKNVKKKIKNRFDFMCT